MSGDLVRNLEALANADESTRATARETLAILETQACAARNAIDARDRRSTDGKLAERDRALIALAPLALVPRR